MNESQRSNSALGLEAILLGGKGHVAGPTEGRRQMQARRVDQRYMHPPRDPRLPSIWQVLIQVHICLGVRDVTPWIGEVKVIGDCDQSALNQPWR